MVYIIYKTNFTLTSLAPFTRRASSYNTPHPPACPSDNCSKQILLINSLGIGYCIWSLYLSWLLL